MSSNKMTADMLSAGDSILIDGAGWRVTSVDPSEQNPAYRSIVVQRSDLMFDGEILTNVQMSFTVDGLYEFDIL